MNPFRIRSGGMSTVLLIAVIVILVVVIGAAAVSVKTAFPHFNPLRYVARHFLR